MKKSLILILSLSIQLGFSQITAGLQGCYPLDNHALNGAPTGPPLDGTPVGVTGAFGHLGFANTAYQFAGNSSSYVRLPGNPPNLKPNTITVSGWYSSDDLANAYLVYTSNGCVFNFEAYALNYYGFGSGGFYVTKSDATCTRVQLFQNTVLHPAPAAGAWTHVVFCIDPTTITLYIDGQYNNSMTHSIPWGYDSTKDVILGNTAEPNYTQPFLGRMDNLRFYDRCLTPDEVYLLYKRDPACDARDKAAGTVGLASHGMGAGSGILSQNSPNPFTNETTINYSIPSTVANASIEVYDMVGKKMASYPLSTTESSVKINSDDLATGIYMYSIIGDGKVMETRRMVVAEK